MNPREYYRPIVQVGPARPDDALQLAGGWTWFTHVEVLARGTASRIVPAYEIPDADRAVLSAARADVSGLTLERPRVMGILNTTPDSFSDGGLHAAATDAITADVAMRDAGVDLLDIGGESTRPGAQTVEDGEEIRRTEPVIAGLRSAGVETLISIDTRKRRVAAAAVTAGAGLINDVSGFTYDTGLALLAAERNLPVCVMHALGDPATMQQDPQYDDVLLDVYDFLERQIVMLTDAGIPRTKIIADPGIGFGKTLDHNLSLLSRISLFHMLGVPILLGASRKRFIGTIGNAPDASSRAPGSIAVALAGLSQGIQVVRVHDVAQTLQAVALWRAATMGTHG